jgi:hypothetical protein
MFYFMFYIVMLEAKNIGSHFEIDEYNWHLCNSIFWFVIMTFSLLQIFLKEKNIKN